MFCFAAMTYLIVFSVAALDALLTFFSGFGLGTLLLPAFALFFTIEKAVALTAIVHFLNGIFKLALVHRHINWSVALRFGLPASLGALAGAWLLVRMAESEFRLRYSLIGPEVAITPAQLIVGLLLLVFAVSEMRPASKKMTFGPRWQIPGGLICGFFGGLAGLQGALRSASNAWGWPPWPRQSISMTETSRRRCHRSRSSISRLSSGGMAIGLKALTFAPPVLPIGRRPTRCPIGTSAMRRT